MPQPSYMKIVTPLPATVNSIRQPKELNTDKIAPSIEGKAFTETNLLNGSTKLEITLSKEGVEQNKMQRLVIYIDHLGNACILFQKVAPFSNHGFSGAGTGILLDDGSELVFNFSETHFKLLCLTEFLRQWPGLEDVYSEHFKKIMELNCPVETLLST